MNIIPENTVEQDTATTGEILPDMEDDISGRYILGRQLANEYHSPAFQAFNRSAAQGVVNPNELTPERIRELDKPLEDPWLDPSLAFLGGAGAAGKLAISSGMRLLPSLSRAVSTGIIGAVADYPIGAATERVGASYPRMALPFNVLAGFVSGATIERAIEKRVVSALGKKANPASISEGIELTKSALERGEPDQIADDVFLDLQGEIPVKDAEKIVGSGVPKSDQTLGSAAETFQTANIPPKTDKYSININMQRIETSADIDNMIRKTSETFGVEIGEARRGKISNEETEALAGLAGITPAQLLNRQKGQAFNAEQALAARHILVSSADNLSSLAKKMTTLEATDLDKFEFRKALNLHYAIQSQVSGMTAEAGRALQSFRIMSSPSVKISQIKEMLTMLPGGASTEKMAEALAGFDSPEQIGAFVKQAQRATTSDMFLEAWINGLLSGPQTHAVNTLSNGLNAVWQIPERFLAATIGHLTGTEAIAEREAVHLAYGLVEGFKDGLKSFARTIKTGESEDVLSKMEMSRYRAITAENVRQLPLVKLIAPNALNEGGLASRAVDILGEAIRLPGRFLMAEDDLFKAIGYRMELRSRAYRTARDEGLEGVEAATRIQDILNEPGIHAPEVHLAAVNAARYQTFTSQLNSRILKDISMSRNLGVKLVMPFIRTPTNILKFGFERTPLAPLMSNVRADLFAGGARRDLALARMSLGSMAMAVVGTLAAEGKITGGGPSGADFSAWRKQHQPYSIEIGDKSYAYNRLEPLGMLFGLAADFTQIAGLAGEELQPEVDRLATAITGALYKNVTSKTWLRGVSELVNAMGDPDRYGERYIHNIVKSFVPTGVAQIERTVDPEMEAVYSIADALKSRIVGLSDSLPPRRDLWGEPITTAISKDRSWAETVYSTLSPVYIAKNEDSIIDQELLTRHIHIQQPNRVQSFEGVKIELDPHQFDDFIQLVNTIPLVSTDSPLKSSLEHMIQHDATYKDAPSELKEIMIRRKFLEARQLAKGLWLDKNPEYRALIADEHSLAFETEE